MSSGFSNTSTGSKDPDPYTSQQKEEPGLKAKITDLVQFMEKNKFCLMTTETGDGLLATRCMALAGKEGNGIDLIFHANTESGKTDDIKANHKVNLGFLNNSGEWASISGQANVETDRQMVHKYYSPGLKAWLGDLGDGKHDGGPDDPRICCIKVNAHTAQYAISNATTLGSYVELAKGVVTGSIPNTNKLRYLSESELQSWRTRGEKL